MITAGRIGLKTATTMPFYKANNVVTHIHHIIPRFETGGVANNHPSNLIELTVEEHAEAHRDRWLMYRHWEDEVAWLTLSGQITNAEGRILANERAQEARTAGINRPEAKQRQIEGIRRALARPETKDKLLARKPNRAFTGHTHDAASRQRMSVGVRLGLTPEVLAKRRIAQRGPKEKRQCPYCPISCAPNVWFRYHNDNCKHRPSHQSVDVPNLSLPQS